MTDSARGQEAFYIHAEIVNNEKLRRDLIARNAVLLEEMREKKYYQDILGDPDGQWAGYLGDLEIFYSRSRVHQLITLYKRLTLKLGIVEGAWAQVPLTRLMDALPVIDENNWEDWFAKAITLTTRDWNIELRQAKGLTSEVDDHEHNMIDYGICTRCGKKEKHQHPNLKAT
jgi:hypothetical protein